MKRAGLIGPPFLCLDAGVSSLYLGRQSLLDRVDQRKMRQESGHLEDAPDRFAYTGQRYTFAAAGDVAMQREQCAKAGAGDIGEPRAIQHNPARTRSRQIEQFHLGGDRVSRRQGAIKRDDEILRSRYYDDLELHRVVPVG